VLEYISYLLNLSSFSLKKKATILILFIITGFPPVVLGKNNKQERYLQNKPTDYVCFVAVGDIMIGRGVNESILKRTPKWPFEKLSKYLNNSDIVFGNAEFSIATSSPAIKEFILGASTTAIKSLKLSGFNIVSLANNHSFDFHNKGLLELISELDKLGICYVGAGKTHQEAQEFKTITKKNTKISFLAYSLLEPDKILSEKNLPAMSMFSEEKLKDDIQKAKKSSDFVFVSFHWGIEYSSAPTRYQKKVAHLAIDSGASVIIGHHPHVFQGVEIYNKGIILYSLGNLIFDSKDKKTKEGLVFECLISSNSIHEPSLLPIYIENLRPTLPEDINYYKNIAQEISILSKEFNTDIIFKKGRVYISYTK